MQSRVLIRWTYLSLKITTSMKIAVTGCNGSVGRRVVKLALERGNKVVGIDVVPDVSGEASQMPWLSSPAFTFEKADLQDFDIVLDLIAGCDAVINLAAYPHPVDYRVKAHNKYVIQIARSSGR